VKLLFIRHSKTIKEEKWASDDALRPLSKKGVKVATDFFKGISRIYRDIDFIISDELTRSIQSARLLSEYVDSEYICDARLNKDASFEDFVRLLDEIKIKKDDIASIAFVADEQIIRLVSKLVSDGSINLKLKKPSLVEISIDNNSAKLVTLLTPVTLK